MQFSQKRRVRSGYLVASLLLLISYLLIFYNTSRLRNQARRVTHAYIVVNKLDRIGRLVTEVETSYSGYLIWRDTASIYSYDTARAKLHRYVAELRALISDNHPQVIRTDSLGGLVDRWLSQMVPKEELVRGTNLVISQQLIDQRNSGQLAMDSIRAGIANMIAVENNLIESRTHKFAGFFQDTRMITILSFVIAAFAIFYSVIIYNRENRAKRSADERTLLYRNELESNIRKLETTNTELKELRGIEKFASTGRVARMIAHEVRNPLTNISLAAEQLKETGTSTADSALLLDMISRNTVRINDLVSDLLNATKSVQIDTRVKDLHELLNETLDLAKDRLELNSIAIEKNYSDEVCTVVVDAEKMKVAFLNIIINAIEAMTEQNGLLQITTKRVGNRCLVEITDNGTGMDDETLQKLFEPFFTKKQKGNGLGLTNTQNIILSHKGNIIVESMPGKGTSFTISIDG